MSDELSGRELDRAIAEALGLNVPPYVHPEIPRKYHASLDALKAVEPDANIINICLEYGEWSVAYCACKDDEIEGMQVASGTGSTEPLARARALLKWLTREGEVDNAG